MDRISELIHQPIRLRIMATVRGLPRGESIDFVRLRTLAGATDGNLGTHINTLANEGLVSVKKKFVNNRPCTRIHLTQKGLLAFERYLAELHAILDASVPNNASESEEMPVSVTPRLVRVP